jgi:hypothetical protein
MSKSGGVIILSISKILPFIQYLYTSIVTSIENPYEMCKYLLPDTKFKLVKEIRGKHLKKIESEIA